jgi:NNP family nitrate/nitrite transporter-like MFS transporter
MGHLRDLARSGHPPTLLCAFLHFDVSFMVWVILGALMPFITTDAALTGQNLRVTPTPRVERAGQYTLLIRGPQAEDRGPQTADRGSTSPSWRSAVGRQQSSVYNLLIKPGDAASATRASVKPVEAYLLDNNDPRTLASVNARSRLIRVELAPEARGNPNENVIALKPAAALAKARQTFQPVANGYPVSVKLTLIAIPLLAAAFWRILLGVLADRFGSRRVGIASLLVTLLPLAVGWRLGSSYSALVFVGCFLGLAGASFAVALPLASRWYPPELQGLAMGIAGAGNSGTVLATLLAPMLAKLYGWHAVMGFLMIPVALSLVLFALLAKDPPGEARPARASAYAAALMQADAWWFCLLYFVTFGGFVGLSSFFNTFFVDQYDAPRAAVGLWTWPFIIAGSFLRPIGGALADRLGGLRMLSLLYGTVIVTAIGVGLLISRFALACVFLFVLMGCLGMGNGSVFQLVPQRFRGEIGVITGLVGAAGGVGGYYLNFVLGHLHDRTGTYASGFFAFASIAAVALIALRAVAPGWTRAWLGKGGVARDRARRIQHAACCTTEADVGTTEGPFPAAGRVLHAACCERSEP